MRRSQFASAVANLTSVNVSTVRVRTITDTVFGGTPPPTTATAAGTPTRRDLLQQRRATADQLAGSGVTVDCTIDLTAAAAPAVVATLRAAADAPAAVLAALQSAGLSSAVAASVTRVSVSSAPAALSPPAGSSQMPPSPLQRAPPSGASAATAEVLTPGSSAGVAVGSAAVVLIAVLGACFWRRRKAQQGQVQGLADDGKSIPRSKFCGILGGPNQSPVPRAQTRSRVAPSSSDINTAAAAAAAREAETSSGDAQPAAPPPPSPPWTQSSPRLISGRNQVSPLPSPAASFRSPQQSSQRTGAQDPADAADAAADTTTSSQSAAAAFFLSGGGVANPLCESPTPAAPAAATPPRSSTRGAALRSLPEVMASRGAVALEAPAVSAPLGGSPHIWMSNPVAAGNNDPGRGPLRAQVSATVRTQSTDSTVTFAHFLREECSRPGTLE